MTDTGEVDIKTVLVALENNGVAVTEQEDGSYILENEHTIEVHRLPPYVRKRMLQYLKRKFGIPIHHFYNPVGVLPKKGQRIQ